MLVILWRFSLVEVKTLTQHRVTQERDQPNTVRTKSRKNFCSVGSPVGFGGS